MKKEKPKVLCYLRAQRLHWGLSAKELAALIGVRDASQMSRLEDGKRTPNLEVAFACQVIFGLSPSEMFPHVHTQAEDRTMWNICQLHSALEKTTSVSGLRKRQLCELALERATGKPKPLEGI